MSTTAIEHEVGENIEQSAGRPRRLRRIGVALGGLAVLVGGGAATWLASGSGGQDTAAVAGPVATAEITQESIADTRSFGGTLGNGEPIPVTASKQGTVTGLGEHGTEVARGTELYRIDEQPVTAMFGDVPMYRNLEEGLSGPDVEQLIENLTGLGHAECDATSEYTACVTEAVEAWQDEIGVEDSGRVAKSGIVFVPSGTQIGSVHSRVGTTVAPGTTIVSLTGTDQIVSTELEVRDRDLLEVGTDVAVELPGGVEVSGTVTASNVVASEPSEQDEAPGPDDTVTEVEVTLGEEVDNALLGSPADIVIEVDERTDVLTVPVSALLALAEGGHGVEVVNDDGTTEIAPVETGLFANGRVEISGDGIDVGTVVGVAGR
jgi:hypothetical protein